MSTIKLGSDTPVPWESASADEVMNRLSVAIAAIPFVGGSLATFMQADLAKKAFARVEEMFVEVHQRLVVLEAEGKVIPSELGDDEDFQEVALRVALAVAREASGDKRRLFREFLTHTIAEGTHPGVREEQLLTALERIDLSHLALLRGLESGERVKGRPTHEQPWYLDVVRAFAGDQERSGAWGDEIDALFADLLGWGLVLDVGNRTYNNEVDWRPTQRAYQLLDHIREDWPGPFSVRTVSSSS